MTTICYRGGVLAADTRAGWGDFMSPQRLRKIWDVGGTLVGISGDITYLQPLIRYIEESGPKPWPGDEARAILVTKTQVRILGAGGENVIDAPFIAIGSGSPAAFAAMHMGADARRAVEIAMLVDPFTGGEIDVLTLDDQIETPSSRIYEYYWAEGTWPESLDWERVRSEDYPHLPSEDEGYVKCQGRWLMRRFKPALRT